MKDLLRPFMKYLTLVLMAVSLLLSCSKPSPVVDDKLANYDCDSVEGVDQLLSMTENKIIMVGESHGSKEPPLLVSALLCHSLKNGYKTALALEIYDENNRYIDFMKSDGHDEDLNKLYTGDWMWEGEFTDGRSSLAMLGLIDKAREYSKEDVEFGFISFKADDIDDLTFDDPNLQTQAYERKMAENVLSHVNDYDKIIGLVGNLHARRAHYTRGERSYDLMAYHMPTPQTFTLRVISKGGTAWNCRGPQPSDCGEHKSGSSIKADMTLFGNDGFVVSLNDNPLINDVDDRFYKNEWYDGVAYVGSISASPPANIQGRRPYEEVAQ